MAVNQPLKGSTNKTYSVITNFNKGIDKKTADDVAVDESFAELINFYNAAEGSLSKRPAVYDSHIVDFIKAILDGNYNENKFNIVTNDFKETKTTLISRLQDFYNTIILGKEKKKTFSGTDITFQIDKIIATDIIKNNKFLEAIQDYANVLEGNYSEVAGTSFIEFGAIIVAGGFTTKGGTNKLCGLYITRVNLTMDYEEGTGYTVKFEIDSVDPTLNNPTTGRRWLYYPEGYSWQIPWNESNYIKDVDEYIPLRAIDIVNYNGYTYIPTGKNYLIKIDQMPETKGTHTKYTNESDVFKIIGGDEEENLYSPTAIELTQIGFNVLSQNPLSLYTTTGSSVKVRGAFYTIDVTKNGETFKQPVAKIPCNGPFYIHVLHTGALPSAYKIEYRENNGETDVAKNPYKTLNGTWKDSNKTIYHVTEGLDTSVDLELKITYGTDEYITYATPTTASVDETGYINEINDLVLSSTRMRTINNQLVLYGGHGYIFFSEYDVFEYFPNYYYIYIANEAGEEAVTSINYFRQYYAIFTNKRIKKMTGVFGADNFGIYPLNDFIGCSVGKTVRAVGNNLIFLGNDGIYQLKQGYLGEGTENVEKLDFVLNNELNLTNVIQAFTINGNYIVVKNDGLTWIIYNTETGAFYEYNLESEIPQIYDNSVMDKDLAKRYLSFYSIFESNIYDSNGNFLVIPMYNYEYNETFTEAKLSKIKFMNFRFADLPYLDEPLKHKDGEGFISTLETHKMNMGYPTNTKKFKDIFIKLVNDSGYAIPLYITVYVDDKKIIDPEKYEIKYDGLTNTYYYVKITESNKALYTAQAIGEFTLGKDTLGDKTIQQIKMRVGAKGRSIKIRLSDGYNNLTELDYTGKGMPKRERNVHDFSISTIGIVYKLKKVKEG